MPGFDLGWDGALIRLPVRGLQKLFSSLLQNLRIGKAIHGGESHDFGSVKHPLMPDGRTAGCHGGPGMPGCGNGLAGRVEHR